MPKRRPLSGVVLSTWLLAGCNVDMAGLGSLFDAGSASGGTDGSAPSEGSPDASMEDASTPTVVFDAAAACPAEGTFALRIDADVRWAGTTFFGIVPIIQPGSGTFSVNTYVDVSKGADGLLATVRACGASIPDFSASVGERYGVTIPSAGWEKLAERWSTSAKRECEEPGCKYTSGLLTAQIGISIPAASPWPTARDPLNPATFVDADGDGLPGFLLLARGELDSPGYKHPPTSYLLTPRISEMMLAIRVSASLDGELDSCDAYGGEAKNMVIETRALGCRLDNGELCNDDQLGFLDDNLPVWSVESARWQMVRMSGSPTCAGARAALP